MTREQVNETRQEILSQGIDCTEHQAEQMVRYYDLLLEKNKVMNLTRIVEFEDALKKHFVDSLILARRMYLSGISNVIDVGSGAGFPGIPLKIVFPHLHMTMIDSVGKKMAFVQEVIDALALKDTVSLHCRAEDLARQKEYREQFDLCVSRAVANLSTLSEYCLPFVKKGGVFAAYKSGECEEEVSEALSAIQILGGGTPRIDHFPLYGMGRTIVFIDKELPTPRKYPRKSGVPSKEPLHI